MAAGIVFRLLLAGGALWAAYKIATKIRDVFSIEVFPPQEHNVVMLGPRGVGKTSVLAGIAYAFEKISRNLASEEWQNLKEMRLGFDAPSRQSIQRTIGDLQATADMVAKEEHPDSGITPAVTSTVSHEQYTFYLSSSKDKPEDAKTITLNFHDYPGGWIVGDAQASPQGRQKVLSLLGNARIVVVVIDAPYLMEEGGRHNEKRNRVRDVVSILRESRAFENQPGMLLLVPNRCEKYY